MVKKQKEANAEVTQKPKRGKDAVWFEEGAYRQRWYGPPEYMWDLMPEREDPKLVYSTFRNQVLNHTEEVCHESAVRHLKRYA